MALSISKQSLRKSSIDQTVSLWLGLCNVHGRGLCRVHRLSSLEEAAPELGYSYWMSPENND